MFLRNNATAQPIPITSDWLGSLSNFIKSLKTCEFDTVDALLAAVAYDEPAAGSMLKRVLVWHTSKSGGEFHLTQRDWWRQCRVNRKTIDRVKTKIFPLCGITVEVKSTSHGKATYYRLHEMKFMRRLAQVINFPLVFVVNRLCPKRTDGCVQNGQMGMSKTDAPLTIESTIKTANDVVKNNVVHPDKKIVDFKKPLPQSTPEQLRVIELLKKAHVPGQRAVSFALLPEIIVRDCITSANEPGVKNRVGYLIGALQKQLAAFKAQASPHPQTPSPKGEVEKYTVDEPEDTPASHSHSLPSAAPIPSQAQQHWDSAYHQIELQFDSQTFNQWLRSARLVGYADGEFVVVVHNQTARDMCQYRLIRTITRILCDVVGQVVTVRFEAVLRPEN